MSLAPDLISHSSFCQDAGLGVVRDALQTAHVAQLKAFFRWMIKNAQRNAPQLGTPKQYFRILKIIYKHYTGTMLDEDVVYDVNAVGVNLTLSAR